MVIAVINMGRNRVGIEPGRRRLLVEPLWYFRPPRTSSPLDVAFTGQIS